MQDHAFRFTLKAIFIIIQQILLHHETLLIGIHIGHQPDVRPEGDLRSHARAEQHTGQGIALAQLIRPETSQRGTNENRSLLGYSTYEHIQLPEADVRVQRVVGRQRDVQEDFLQRTALPGQWARAKAVNIKLTDAGA